MRYLLGFLMLLLSAAPARALTPRLDTSLAFFAGEWAGSGERGAYCYLKLNDDGSGVVFVDGGTGDWLGARLQWRNQQQALQIDKILPLANSFQRRIMPLDAFVLRSGFNQSLSLSWNPQAVPCQLQKIETLAQHLNWARTAVEGLTQGDKP